MKRISKLFIKNKKVSLSDVASPKPSRAATRVVKDALVRAHKDQQIISKKAQALRAN